MTLDLDRAPQTGALRLPAFIEDLKTFDDTHERYFLELKSDVDLNTKYGRAKVAKFILGCANRDPVLAAKRFQGYAVMALGVGNGSADGIPKFETRDLQRDVVRWVGPHVKWDLYTHPISSGKHVALIVVDPPDVGGATICGLRQRS